MRLLHLHSGNLYGGIERVLVTLARAGRDAGGRLDQRFALFFEGRLAQELRAAGAPPSMLGPAPLRRPWRVLHARRALARVLAGVRPDVVLVHSPWSAAVAGRTISASGARCALWLHNPPNHRVWPDRWALRRRFDLVIANSPYTARAAAGRLRVSGWLYPPVAAPPADAPTARAETRSRLGAAERDVVILQASRIERWKGLRDHLEALANLRDVPRWMAWIAGAPQRRSERALFDELRGVAVHEGIADRVRFLGHRTDVPELMAASDIYCQPNSEPEPFGVAFVEAMWAARPIVTTTAGGLSDEIAGACGIVVPRGDRAAIAGAVRELVLSAERRASLGGEGPRLAAALCDPSQQLRRLGSLLADEGDRTAIA
ncbi:MAG TPA: glycosyltransferase family 4 protein [Vicinamibacterales bacterium]|nr:glycosyltransferase family 4 protein [Vicinamibacterales bacterium]